MFASNRSAFDILEAEKGSILSLLSNKSNANQTKPANIWKVLIYDERGQQILAPLIKLGVLRQHGVTLNLLLESHRYSVPDAMAIYFIEPTEQNIDRISNDIQKRLYKSFQIEFISPIATNSLKEFASKVAALPPFPDSTTPAALINSVHDRYANFVAFSSTVFSLEFPQCFPTLYSPKADETKIQEMLSIIVDGLICVIRTLNIRPVIKIPVNQASPARAVGLLLDTRLREISESRAARESNGWPNSTPATRRPILVLTDRSLDFFIMVSHTWSYEALIHDFYGINLNRVCIESSVEKDQGSRKVYELDVSSDSFWNESRQLDYPEAAMAISTMMEKFSQDLKNLNSQKEDAGRRLLVGGTTDTMDGKDLTKNIAATLEAAPEIIQKKQCLDMHTNIAGMLLNDIRKRQIDKFYELETSLVDSNVGSLHLANNAAIAVEKFIQDSAASTNTYEDRIRLLLCLHLCCSKLLPRERIDRIASLIQLNSPVSAASPLPDCLRFMRHFETMTVLKPPEALTHLYSNKPQSTSAGSVLGSAAAQWSSAVMDKSKGLFLQGVKQLMSIKQEPNIVKLCEAFMMEGRSNDSVTKEYTTLDPLGTGKDVNMPVVKNALVFAVGGGSYVEAEALQQFAKRAEKRIVYGSTAMLRPTTFVDQLSTIAKQLD